MCVCVCVRASFKYRMGHIIIAFRRQLRHTVKEQPNDDINHHHHHHHHYQIRYVQQTRIHTLLCPEVGMIGWKENRWSRRRRRRRDERGTDKSLIRRLLHLHFCSSFPKEGKQDQLSSEQRNTPKPKNGNCCHVILPSPFRNHSSAQLNKYSIAAS